VNEFLFGQRVGEKFRNQGGNISQLRTLGESWGLAPTGEAVVFVDNHDKQRGHAGGGAYITHQDGVLYDLANVFMLGWPYGYPQLMSSYAFTNGDQGPPSDGSGNTRPIYSSPSSTTPDCFGDWKCEHRWRPIANMVAFRNTVGSTAVTNWWDDAGDRIAFGRGDRGFVIVNRGSSTLSRTFQTGLAAGVYCDVIAGDFASGACSGRTLTVGSTGQVAVSVPPMFAAALHVGARLGSAPPSPGGTATVAFAVNATTWFGQNVYVVGNLPQLGSWNPAAAIPLSAATYPVWRANVSLPASTAVEYKYIKKPADGGGSVQWETAGNRTLTTPASGTLQRSETWR
jgi:alpha-amylase